MAVLGDEALRARLSDLPGWAVEGDAIRKEFSFDGFPAAIAFVDRLAEAAEEANHHPDIDIRYQRVTLTLSTHSEGGVTELDLRLALIAQSLAPDASDS